MYFFHTVDLSQSWKKIQVKKLICILVKINFLLWIFNCQVSYINDHTLLYVLKQLRNTLFDKNFVKLFGFCFSVLWPVAQEWRLVYNNTQVMTSWLQNWTLCLYYLLKSSIMMKTRVSENSFTSPHFQGFTLSVELTALTLH